ncbi:MAG: hypothetical protein KBT30_01865 [Clostridiales bacterium]|nr:hypothetical protein [Candidatus Apopatousia equi]
MTYEEAIEISLEALKKQIPTKPIIGFFGDINGVFDCPNCGVTICSSDDITEHNYCLNCGQALDWE